MSLLCKYKYKKYTCVRMKLVSRPSTIYTSEIKCIRKFNSENNYNYQISIFSAISRRNCWKLRIGWETRKIPITWVKTPIVTGEMNRWYQRSAHLFCTHVGAFSMCFSLPVPLIYSFLNVYWMSTTVPEVWEESIFSQMLSPFFY